jgi:hypothetical protein
VVNAGYAYDEPMHLDAPPFEMHYWYLTPAGATAPAP